MCKNPTEANVMSTQCNVLIPHIRASKVWLWENRKTNFSAWGLCRVRTGMDGWAVFVYVPICKFFFGYIQNNIIIYLKLLIDVFPDFDSGGDGWQTLKLHARVYFFGYPCNYFRIFPYKGTGFFEFIFIISIHQPSSI